MRIAKSFVVRTRVTTAESLSEVTMPEAPKIERDGGEAASQPEQKDTAMDREDEIAGRRLKNMSTRTRTSMSSTRILD